MSSSRTPRPAGATIAISPPMNELTQAAMYALGAATASGSSARARAYRQKPHPIQLNPEGHTGAHMVRLVTEPRLGNLAIKAFLIAGIRCNALGSSTRTM